MRDKEKQRAYNKAYHIKNREKILKRKEFTDKERAIKNKHNPLVYLVVNENYVGTTENLQQRLWKHSADYKRDVSEVIILGSFNNRADALELEEALHNEGYKGKHRFNLYK